MSTRPQDFRNEIAKARDQWLGSKEGLECMSPSILNSVNSKQFLENRLMKAFMAGAEAQEKIQQGKAAS